MGHSDRVEENWNNISEFPMYSVSTEGRVRRDSSGRMLIYTPNQYGIICVGLMRGEKQHHRSVPLLVARAFIQNDREAFDTPINLNGDRWDNRVQNLIWRPRWFAIAYNRQFHNLYENPINLEIRDCETGLVFPNSMSVAINFGLLEKDVVLSIINNTIAWPTLQKFEIVE